MFKNVVSLSLNVGKVEKLIVDQDTYPDQS